VKKGDYTVLNFGTFFGSQALRGIFSDLCDAVIFVTYRYREFFVFWLSKGELRPQIFA
jgi:hypothetical protein